VDFSTESGANAFTHRYQVDPEGESFNKQYKEITHKINKLLNNLNKNDDHLSVLSKDVGKEFE